MKVAIIGSGNLNLKNFDQFIPKNTIEIVIGGAQGTDTCAKQFAKMHGIKIKEFLPDYKKFKKSAPFKRNDEIIDYCDEVIAFWDGFSEGTKYVIHKCNKKNKKITVFMIENISKETGV